MERSDFSGEVREGGSPRAAEFINRYHPLCKRDKKRDLNRKTNQNSAVMIAKGRINGIEVTAGAINFDFIGGSVGAAEGEAIIYGVQHAIDNQTPFVFFPCGGGQRMFESTIALANMTRTTLAINELKNNNLPYIVCFTDPTAGGITASYAMLGDLHIAESDHALIAFAGARVIEGTVKESLPKNFKNGVNFAISLSVWDYLFGTNFIPKADENIKLGYADDHKMPASFWGQLFYGFRQKD